jgi:hypothetical protein
MWEDIEILQEDGVSGADASAVDENRRYIGAGRNRLLTGVLLHQRRVAPRVMPDMCTPEGERFFSITGMCTSMEMVKAVLVVRNPFPLLARLPPYTLMPDILPTVISHGPIARCDPFISVYVVRVCACARARVCVCACVGVCVCSFLSLLSIMYCSE